MKLWWYFYEKIDLYNKHIKLEFNSFIRNEKKFNSINDLVDQIKKDIELLKK